MSQNPAFFTLAALYQRMHRTAKEYNLRTTKLNGTSYSSDSTSETTYRLKEPIVVSNTNLVDQCTNAEWKLIGFIMRDMYQNNALWRADPEKKRTNSTYKIGLQGLLKKEILFSTETPHMYIVNPVHIRRGDPFAVAAATANMVMNRRPTVDMLEDKRPLSSFDFQGIEDRVRE